MAKFKVLEMGTGTGKTGKSYKKLKLEGPNGEHSVYIFSDFPHYAEITFGSEIDGEIKKNDKGYDNLYSNEIKSGGGAGSAFKTAQIEKSMERKEQSIGKFQDNKEFSIMVASSMSGAVALAVAEYRDATILDGLDKAVLRWRQFILDNWSVDPKDIKPF